jgi:hypothetical protein
MGLVSTKTGLRLLATDNDISYRAVIAPWAGTTFAKWHLAKEEKGNCTTGSHDLNTDASGRLVDVSNWCGKLSIADLPNQTTAALVQFNPGDVEGSVPQVTTTPRGHGVVVWSVLSGAGNRLYFNRFLLPGLDTSVTKAGVTVTGPVSCQPASTIAVSVKGSLKGWKVASASLTIGGKKVASKATLNGATLTAGKVYSLVGKVVFTKGGVSRVGTATLKFRSCVNP